MKTASYTSDTCLNNSYTLRYSLFCCSISLMPTCATIYVHKLASEMPAKRQLIHNDHEKQKAKKYRKVQ